MLNETSSGVQVNGMERFRSVSITLQNVHMQKRPYGRSQSD